MKPFSFITALTVAELAANLAAAEQRQIITAGRRKDSATILFSQRLLSFNMMPPVCRSGERRLQVQAGFAGLEDGHRADRSVANRTDKMNLPHSIHPNPGRLVSWTARMLIGLNITLALGASRSFAQSAPSAPSPSSSASRSAAAAVDAVELSPFVVNAAKDSGYVTKDSLSGSSFSQNLDDIPSNIARRIHRSLRG